jgi:hypothetical protein
MTVTEARVSWPAAAAAGALAAAAALGTAELAAGLTGGRSLIVGVGDWVINHAPHALVAFGKRNFGTNDKPALVVSIVIVSLLFGAALGILATRRAAVGVGGIVAFGIAGVLATLTDPLHSIHCTRPVRPS